MGFLSRVVPGGGRPAGQAGDRARTPKGMKRIRRAMRRLRKTARGVTRSLTPDKRRTKGKKPVAVYRHGTCPVNHRSRKAAARCRRTR